MRFTTRCSQTLQFPYGLMASTSCEHGRIAATLSNAYFDNWWYTSPAALDADSERGMGGGVEVERSLLDFERDSIGPAIEDDVRVFVTQQRGFFALAASKACILPSRKPGFVATTS